MRGRWKSAAEVAAALGGRFRSHSARVRCPVKDHSSGETLAISETRDGRVLVFCHAGCESRDVIAELKRLGLWGDSDGSVDPSFPAYATTPYDGIDKKTDRVKREQAQDIWDHAKPLAGTPAHEYLKARGIRLPVSDQLRFSSACYHSPTRNKYPALIARLQDDRGFCGIQRTYLDPKLPKKLATGDPKIPVKMTKGPMGEGAVRLYLPRERLGIAEGIETALSARMLYSIPTWAVLGAKRLGKIAIPPTVKQIVLFSDAGTVGRDEAFSACDIYERRGYDVEIITPQADHHDPDASDFNDILRGKPKTSPPADDPGAPPG